MTDFFNINTTDIIFYDKLLKNGKGFECGNIEVIATLEYITPEEYFNQCTKLHNSTIEEEYKYISEDNMKELANVVEKGKLPIGFLNYVIKAQEGRHRALLAKRMNINLIPVLIIRQVTI